LIADFDSLEVSDEADFVRQLAELISDVEAEQVYEANDWSDVDLAVA
jgi:hypothetical protein